MMVAFRNSLIGFGQMWSAVLLILLVFIMDVSEQIAPKGHPKETKTKSVEKSLIRMLLNRYEQFGVIGRPVNDSKIQVAVSYGLQLFQILDLDENKQILHTNCWAMYSWNDALLRWNTSEYGDIKTVRIFPSHIWTPDIKLYNFADERLKEHREARVVIYNDGSTLWVPQALFKSTCEVEITYFPFDTQICMLEFGSWTYDKTQMDIVWWLPDGEGTLPMPYVDFSDYVPSNEWRTDGELERDVHHTNRTIQIRSVKKYRRRNQTVGNHVATRNYPVLRYLVRLRRNPSFYVFMLVIPCVLLSSLTLVVFWLPPESPAKMMLGMNIFVAFFVLLILLAESTPSAVKNFPLIGVYFCLNMIMITLSTFLATLVIHLYFRGDRNGAVPPILRRLIIEGIGRLLLVRQRIPLSDVKKSAIHISPRTSGKLQRREVSGSNFPMNKSSFREEPQGGMAHLQPGIGLAAGYPMFGDHAPYDVRATGIPGFCGPSVGGVLMMPKYPAGYCEPCTCGAAGEHQDMNVVDPTGTSCTMDKTAFGFIHPGIHDPSVGGVENGAAGSSDADDETKGWRSSTATLERDVREVKRYVRAFVGRQKEMHRKSLVAMEWRTLALVLDRLFFFLYITTIAIAVIISVPRSTEPELPDAFRDSETF